MIRFYVFTFFGTLSSLICLSNISTAQLSASVNSLVYKQQVEVRLDLSFNRITLKAALNRLAEAYYVGAGYNAALVPDVIVNVEVKSATLTEALNELLRDTDLQGFLTQGNNITLKKRPPSKPVAYASLRGEVSDATSNTSLPGANILIKETSKGTITDVDGNFRLDRIEQGTYTLIVSYIGYETKSVIVSLVEGEDKLINVRLIESSNQLSEVQVEAKRIVNTDINVLDERKKSAVVQDAISFQSIEETASITATQALQKVTGVSVKDGKYISVRGLAERNIVVQLNGARLSSADPLRSGAVPLDIIPAQLLDNISVQKTMLPDRAGDASGALVELKIRSLPDTFSVNFSAQAGGNDKVGVDGMAMLFPNGKLGAFGEHAYKHRLTSEFRDIATVNSTTDVGSFGYTSLYNKIREGRNSSSAAERATEINRVQEQIDPYLATAPIKVPVNQIYSLNVSNMFNVAGEKRLGVLLGVNYFSNVTQVTNGTNNRYQVESRATTPNNIELVSRFRFREDAGSHTVQYGGIGVVTYKINRFNEASANYITNRGFESGGVLLSSKAPDFNLYSYQLSTSIRTFNTLQFRGEHKPSIFGYRPLISWNFSTSGTLTDLPDFRNSFLLADTNGTVVNNRFLPEFYDAAVTRYYRNLKEDNRNFILDLLFPLTKKGVSSSFKTGLWFLNRDRSYTENQLLTPTNERNSDAIFTYLESISGGLNTVRGDLNNWLIPERVGIAEAEGGHGGLFVPGYNYYLVSGSKASQGGSHYDAHQHVTSLYAMIDLEFLSRIKMAAGMRVEDTDTRAREDSTSVGKSIATLQQYLNEFTVDQQEMQWLPSGIITYKLNDNINFRFAASKTLNRPEIVELVSFSTYDASQLSYVTGNSKLKNAIYTNLDFRWEYFPRAGEVLAVSLFGKRIKNGLERIFLSSNNQHIIQSPNLVNLIPISSISFRNNPVEGILYGIELEAVRDLDFISPSLKNFKLGTNAMFAYSETEITTAEHYIISRYDRTQSKKRPLFDQPNVIFNVNLGYRFIEQQLITTFYFNYSGRRLVEINTDGTPNIYEYPGAQFDFIFSKTFGERFQLKGFIKNVLDSRTDYVYQRTASSTEYGVENKTYYRRQFTTGRNFALGVSYTF
jgi:TonB-dependent receptor